MGLKEVDVGFQARLGPVCWSASHSMTRKQIGSDSPLANLDAGGTAPPTPPAPPAPTAPSGSSFASSFVSAAASSSLNSWPAEGTVAGSNSCAWAGSTGTQTRPGVSLLHSVQLESGAGAFSLSLPTAPLRRDLRFAGSLRGLHRRGISVNDSSLRPHPSCPRTIGQLNDRLSLKASHPLPTLDALPTAPIPIGTGHIPHSTAKTFATLTQRIHSPVPGCTQNGLLSKWFLCLETSASILGYVYCRITSSIAFLYFLYDAVPFFGMWAMSCSHRVIEGASGSASHSALRASFTSLSAGRSSRSVRHPRSDWKHSWSSRMRRENSNLSVCRASLSVSFS